MQPIKSKKGRIIIILKRHFPRKGDIFFLEEKNSFGVEIAGNRPVLIIQNDIGNMYSHTTLVAPLTSSECKKVLPTHVFLARDRCGIRKNSRVLLEQIKAIDIDRLDRYIITLDEDIMKKVDVAIATSFGINQPERKTWYGRQYSIQTTH